MRLFALGAFAGGARARSATITLTTRGVDGSGLIAGYAASGGYSDYYSASSYPIGAITPSTLRGFTITDIVTVDDGMGGLAGVIAVAGDHTTIGVTRVDGYQSGGTHVGGVNLSGWTYNASAGVTYTAWDPFVDLFSPADVLSNGYFVLR